jgi:hypothetical protein
MSSDSIATTRISDLPENITVQMDTGFGNSDGYKPMNVHPNPYGNSIHPQAGPPLPQAKAPTKPENPQFQLPSRDIPMNTEGYTYDEQIQANYIPKPKLTVDFVKEYEDTTEKDIREHQSKKHRKRMIDNLFEEFQIPLLVAALFLVFQLPVLNTLLYKYFSLLGVFQNDGNANFYGYLLKSGLFGAAFYFIMKTTTIISEW